MSDTSVPSLIVIGIAINQLEITPGWPCYLGIPGYLDKGVSYINKMFHFKMMVLKI